MGNKGKGLFCAFFVFFQPFFKVFRPGKYHRGLTPSGNGQHLRMVRSAHDHGLPAPFFRRRHDFVDAGDVGTGGVKDLHSPPGEGLVDSPALSVGADDDGAAIRYVLRPVHRPKPLSGQASGHVLVVNEGAQHDTGNALGGLLLGQLHRPADSVAEAGGFGQHNLHPTPSPRAFTRPIRSRAMV